MIQIMKYKKAFTVTEIIVATCIFVAIFFSLMLLTTSSRKETSKSINYLRALELAQEAVDWVNAVPFDQVTDTNLAAHLSGSLVSLPIPVGKNANNTNAQKPCYPKEYGKCYYFRTVKIENLNGIANNKYMKKINIGIFWNENKVPTNVETTLPSGEPDRMRKLTLSTIIFNDKESY